MACSFAVAALISFMLQTIKIIHVTVLRNENNMFCPLKYESTLQMGIKMLMIKKHVSVLFGTDADGALKMVKVSF